MDFISFLIATVSVFFAPVIFLSRSDVCPTMSSDSQPTFIPPPPNKNIVDINYTIFSTICQDLDLDGRWRELIGHADGSRYRLTLVTFL